MTPELQTFAQKDTGFRQFCDQYKRVASDPNTRREYQNWCGQMMIDATREAMVKAEGRRERALKDAKFVLAMGHTPEEVAMALELPLADVEALI